MRNVLQAQFKKYPKMQIQDMVKLIYQNEFAGSHMMDTYESVLVQIEDECRSLQRGHGGESFDRIGNGLCRMHLEALNDMGISAHTLSRFFTNTARLTRGDRKRLEDKLQIFWECCLHGVLPFNAKEVSSFIKDYQRRGYPPVRHSEAYKEAYSPSYRVIRSIYQDFIEVFSKLEDLLNRQDFVCVAIEGRCAAGKSTLAQLISGVYDSNVFYMDHFFLRPEQRTGARFNKPGGNVDYQRFYKDVFVKISNKQSFSYCAYDCKENRMSKPIHVKPKKLNIVEGTYCMRPELIDSYDLKIFLDICPGEQSARILERNGDAMHKTFIDQWIPMEEEYFIRMHIADQCDLHYDTSMTKHIST